MSSPIKQLGVSLPINHNGLSVSAINMPLFTSSNKLTSLPATHKSGSTEDNPYSVHSDEVGGEPLMLVDDASETDASHCHMYCAPEHQTSEDDGDDGDVSQRCHPNDQQCTLQLDTCNSPPSHKSRLSDSPTANGLKLKGATVEKISRTNLYIKGLPDSFNDEKLWHLPPDSTQIKSVKAAMDDDCRCRGYGFIDFISEVAANEAIRYIKETHPTFTIKFAKENEKDRSNLYVTNLPKSWTTKDSDQLKSLFERFGTIQSAFVMMERTTNRTTGVGFVRFANERHALDALDAIKNQPIILPECTLAIEAKFADKHNPETRRRRYPASVPLVASHQPNSLFNTYPLGLTNSANHMAGSQDPLTTFLSMHHSNNSTSNSHLSSHSASSVSPKGPLSGSTVNLHSLQSKGDYTHRLTQSLLTTSAKLSAAANSSNLTPLGLTDFPVTTVAHPQVVPTMDQNLATLTAAAAAAGLLNRCFHSDALMSPAPVTNNTGTSGLLSTNPLSFMTTSGTLPSAEAALLNPGLYACPFYGTEFYRAAQTPTAHHPAQVPHPQPQQHRNLFEATIAAISGSGSVPSLLPNLPDLTPFIHYPGLLASHQAVGLNGSSPCLRSSTGAANMGAMYAHAANGLVGTETLLNQNGTISSESVGLMAQKSLSSLQPWMIPNHQLIKHGTIETSLASVNHNLNV